MNVMRPVRLLYMIVILTPGVPVNRDIQDSSLRDPRFMFYIVMQILMNVMIAIHQHYTNVILMPDALIHKAHIDVNVRLHVGQATGRHVKKVRITVRIYVPCTPSPT